MGKQRMPARNDARPAPADSRSNIPIHVIRHRNLKASIWRNPTEKGTLYNVSVVRGYRNSENQWQDSHSFGYDDLPIIVKLLNDCHSLITTLRERDATADRRSNRDAAEPAPRSSR
jgi:hypothetical protein